MGNGFAQLLRRHRPRRSLTQEMRAERAGMSSRSLGEMERRHGRSPRPRAVDQLAAALELSGADRQELCPSPGQSGRSALGSRWGACSPVHLASRSGLSALAATTMSVIDRSIRRQDGPV